MIIKTGRFGQLNGSEAETITIPAGILGFPEYKKFCLVDPGDDTLILWLQSLDDPALAFPVLEPKIFNPQYVARLSGVELQELKLENLNRAAVFNILTIGEDVTQMTANTKAPLIINLEQKIAKQVVLQENEYNVKHPMFNELRIHLITLSSMKKHSEDVRGSALVPVSEISPSSSVRSLLLSL